MLLSLVGMSLAAPLVIDFQDGLSKSAIEKEFQIEIQWVHPLSEDEALAYPKSTPTEEQMRLLSSSETLETQNCLGNRTENSTF